MKWSGLVARILIVEDEPQVLTLAASVLQPAGYEVISAATLSEAEAVIDDTARKFDLLFIEIELGYEKEGGIASRNRGPAFRCCTLAGERKS